MSMPLGVGGVIAGTIIGLIIAIPALWIRLRLNAANMPSEEKKKEVLADVREWKKQGLSFEQRKVKLRELGFRPDVAETLLAQAELILNE